ncbi:MAG: hypothetical protein LBG67_02325 [Campylobacteraceae bacterium]|jgi:cysteinyl-tRNA synthetase|nr:hypothetical protein [Campylobacteraceae bacterium]
MKKVIILLVALSWTINACECQPQIDTILNTVSKHIQDALNEEIQALNNNLIPAVKNATKNINSQNEVMVKIIEAEKLKAIQNKEIIFNLQKINQLN